MSKSFWLKGIDSNIIGGAVNLSDVEILECRSCQCEHRQSEEVGIPDGFCGICECGKPGHLSHYPGPVPFSGVWCDEHYLLEARTNRMLGGIRPDFVSEK